MEKNSEIGISNSGDNSGVIFGVNNGTVNFQSESSIRRIPSKIVILVKALGSVCIDEDEPEPSNLIAFEPDQKIRFNCVLKYRDLITEFSTYFTKCEETMNVYDNSDMGSKKRILLWVKKCYLEFKGDLILAFNYTKEENIEIVRKNADLLIDKVCQKIKDTILQSSNNNEIYHEDMELGIICFVCYCFMKCKILEKPL